MKNETNESLPALSRLTEGGAEGERWVTTDRLTLIREHDAVWSDRSIPLKERVRKCRTLHRQILWDHIAQDHDLHLTESELDDVLSLAKEKQPSAFGGSPDAARRVASYEETGTRTEREARILRALAAIEVLVSDDFCEDLEMRTIPTTPENQQLAGDLKTCEEKISKIYCIAHGELPHSCYGSHEEWRKVKDEILAHEPELLAALRLERMVD